MKLTITQEITNANKSEFYAQLKNGKIVRIWEGTGDALMPEDVEAGYVDYINYEFYNSVQAIYDQDYSDGGYILLTKLYQEMSVEQIINAVEKELDEEIVKGE